MYEGMIKMLMSQMGIDPVAMKANMEQAKIEYTRLASQIERIENKLDQLLQQKIGNIPHE